MNYGLTCNQVKIKSADPFWTHLLYPQMCMHMCVYECAHIFAYLHGHFPTLSKLRALCHGDTGHLAVLWFSKVYLSTSKLFNWLFLILRNYFPQIVNNNSPSPSSALCWNITISVRPNTFLKLQPSFCIPQIFSLCPQGLEEG